MSNGVHTSEHAKSETASAASVSVASREEELGWPPSTASALLAAAPLTLRQGDVGGRAAGQSFIQLSQRMEAQLKVEAEEYSRQGEELAALRQAAVAHASRTIPFTLTGLQQRVQEIQRAAEEEKKMAAQAEAAKNQHIKKRLKLEEQLQKNKDLTDSRQQAELEDVKRRHRILADEVEQLSGRNDLTLRSLEQHVNAARKCAKCKARICNKELVTPIAKSTTAKAAGSGSSK